MACSLTRAPPILRTFGPFSKLPVELRQMIIRWHFESTLEQGPTLRSFPGHITVGGVVHQGTFGKRIEQLLRVSECEASSKSIIQGHRCESVATWVSSLDPMAYPEEVHSSIY